jgi:2-polyprenyl-3-methyl-5-hydroxy-6-metoxy-1,4-benzoquinol methylase
VGSFHGSQLTRSCPVCRTDSPADVVQLGGYQLFLCPRCSLRFAPDAFEQTVDYDGVYRSAEYESDQVRALRSLNGSELARHPTYRAFFRQVRHRPGARLLDVGCGVGRFAHAAHTLGWDVTGIDVSPLAIDIGREFATFPLRVATLEEMINRDERFDVLTAFEVLEHLASPVQFLASAQQLLRFGGQIFCTVPNWNSSTVRSTLRPDWLPPIHLLFFTQAALQCAGGSSGLVGVNTGVIRADPPPTGLVAKARWLARRALGHPREALGVWLHGWRKE